MIASELLTLPKLLYVGDVPVESTVAGSALIYRLLQKYPVSKLQIVEGNTTVSESATRLGGVKYEVLNVGRKRLINSRLNTLYSSYLFLTARQRASQLIATIKNFQPEAILTVAHGFSWLTAAELAKHYKLPLHLIVHDDLPSYIPIVPQLKASLNQQFAEVYRQAESRLCVSPYMVECYHQRYGVSGEVVYPSRAEDLQEVDSTPNAKKLANSSLTYAYAGSINSQGYSSALVNLALTIERSNHKLLIYSSLTPESIVRNGMCKSNIKTHSLVPSQKLIETLRQKADVLFVPMSFEFKYKFNMQLCFPSKLTDYTAIGLPLLIWGPSYCSAVRWAKDNPGVAEVVDTNSIDALQIAVDKLNKDSQYRDQLGLMALKKGQEYFSHSQAINQFYQHITLKVASKETILS